jgi:hypothetical protein
MSVALLPSSVWSSSRSERACESLSSEPLSSEPLKENLSFSCLLSIQTDEPENSIIGENFETPLHCWSDDSKLFLMEEGKLDDEGFGQNDSRTPLFGVAHPAWTFRTKSEEYDENSRTPLSHGAVWPAGMSKVQPLAPLDLGPGWYQLDTLMGSKSLTGGEVAAEGRGERKATSKEKLN